MRFNGWICSLIIALVATGAQATEKENCISRTEMQEISNHFTQFKNIAEKGDYCFDGSQTSHLLAGIMFMRKTQFASSMPNSPDELFSGRFANNWYDYFIGRINQFEVQESCPKGVGAFVYFFGNTMFVCPMLLTENFTALDRASVFMHEARHIDGFPHMTCTNGPRQGLNGACDTRISDGGSYAVTVETYAQLAAYAGDLHPALRAYARSSAVLYADEAFETPARVARTLQLLVMTKDQQFHSIRVDGGGSDVKALGRSPSLGHIVMRGQHMILYPDDKNLPAKYVFARSEGDIQQAAGDIAVEYNSQTPQQRSQLVDVHIAGQWSAKIFADKTVMSCDPRSDARSEVAFKGETAAGMVYPNGYDRGSSKASLIMTSGRVFEMGCENKVGYVRAANIEFDQKFKRIHKAGNEIIGLTEDGRLHRINGARSTPLVTAIDGQIHEMAPNQQVDFFDK